MTASAARTASSDGAGLRSHGQRSAEAERLVAVARVVRSLAASGDGYAHVADAILATRSSLSPDDVARLERIAREMIAHGVKGRTLHHSAIEPAARALVAAGDVQPLQAAWRGMLAGA